MKIIYGENERVAAWATGQITKPMGSLCHTFLPPYTALGLADDTGRIRGAVVLTGFTGAEIELSVYGRGCWTRRVIRAVFDALFNTMLCARVTVHVRASNREAEDLASRLGFKREGIVRRKYGNEDGILMGMLREECRWLKGAH